MLPPFTILPVLLGSDINLSISLPPYNPVKKWLQVDLKVLVAFCTSILHKSYLAPFGTQYSMTYILCKHACICMQLNVRIRTSTSKLTIILYYLVLSALFYLVLGPVILQEPIQLLSCPVSLINTVKQSSGQVISQVTYGYIIVQGF